MHAIDWAIIGLYLVTAVAVGVYFSKRAARSTTDFFVAGRTLGWFVAGTSIVATTFSADTPLFVAGMTRTEGIFKNWFWWNAAIGQIACVFFFARLWRRSKALTDIEFVTQRYEDCTARKVLRMFKVFFDGIFLNCAIMASATLGMAKLMTIMLDLSDTVLFEVPLVGGVNSTALLLMVLGAIAVLYSTLSGLYGVVYTDLIQFTLAMIGSIVLAVFVYQDASAGEGFMAKLQSVDGFDPALLNVFPDLSTFSLLSFSFFVYMGLFWSAEVAGTSYHVQRMLAAKSERDSMLAFLWFNICNYVIRPWPWIIVAIMSLYYFPVIDDPEDCFALMMNKFLPVGFKGIMVCAMLAAFMSTLDTHLNVGTAYFVNDLYRPFIAPGRDEKHYILVSRIGMLVLVLIALIVASMVDSIFGIFIFLGLMFAGVGTITIARWYWWRVNVYSEIAAIGSTFVLGLLLQYFIPDRNGADYFAVRVTIIIFAVLGIWMLVAWLTSSKPGPQAIEFYKRLRVGGPGWRKIAEMTQVDPISAQFGISFVAWLSCTVFLYATLLGVGKFIVHEWLWGGVYTVVAVLSGLVLKSCMGKISFGIEDEN